MLSGSVPARGTFSVAAAMKRATRSLKTNGNRSANQNKNNKHNHNINNRSRRGRGRQADYSPVSSLSGRAAAEEEAIDAMAEGEDGKEQGVRERRVGFFQNKERRTDSVSPFFTPQLEAASGRRLAALSEHLASELTVFQQQQQQQQKNNNNVSDTHNNSTCTEGAVYNLKALEMNLQSLLLSGVLSTSAVPNAVPSPSLSSSLVSSSPTGGTLPATGEEKDKVKAIRSATPATTTTAAVTAAAAAESTPNRADTLKTPNAAAATVTRYSEEDKITRGVNEDAEDEMFFSFSSSSSPLSSSSSPSALLLSDALAGYNPSLEKHEALLENAREALAVPETLAAATALVKAFRRGVGAGRDGNFNAFPSTSSFPSISSTFEGDGDSASSSSADRRHYLIASQLHFLHRLLQRLRTQQRRRAAEVLEDLRHRNHSGNKANGNAERGRRGNIHANGPYGRGGSSNGSNNAHSTRMSATTIATAADPQLSADETTAFLELSAGILSRLHGGGASTSAGARGSAGGGGTVEATVLDAGDWQINEVLIMQGKPTTKQSKILEKRAGGTTRENAEEENVGRNDTPTTTTNAPVKSTDDNNTIPTPRTTTTMHDSGGGDQHLVTRVVSLTEPSTPGTFAADTHATSATGRQLRALVAAALRHSSGSSSSNPPRSANNASSPYSAVTTAPPCVFLRFVLYRDHCPLPAALDFLCRCINSRFSSSSEIRHPPSTLSDSFASTTTAAEVNESHSFLRVRPEHFSVHNVLEDAAVVTQECSLCIPLRGGEISPREARDKQQQQHQQLQEAEAAAATTKITEEDIIEETASACESIASALVEEVYHLCVVPFITPTADSAETLPSPPLAIQILGWQSSPCGCHGDLSSVSETSVAAEAAAAVAVAPSFFVSDSLSAPPSLSSPPPPPPSLPPPPPRVVVSTMAQYSLLLRNVLARHPKAIENTVKNCSLAFPNFFGVRHFFFPSFVSSSSSLSSSSASSFSSVFPPSEGSNFSSHSTVSNTSIDPFMPFRSYDVGNALAAGKWLEACVMTLCLMPPPPPPSSSPLLIVSDDSPAANRNEKKRGGGKTNNSNNAMFNAAADAVKLPHDNKWQQQQQQQRQQRQMTSLYEEDWRVRLLLLVASDEDRPAVLAQQYHRIVPAAVRNYFARAKAHVLWNVLASCRVKELAGLARGFRVSGGGGGGGPQLGLGVVPEAGEFVMVDNSHNTKKSNSSGCGSGSSFENEGRNRHNSNKNKNKNNAEEMVGEEQGEKALSNLLSKREVLQEEVRRQALCFSAPKQEWSLPLLCGTPQGEEIEHQQQQQQHSSVTSCAALSAGAAAHWPISVAPLMTDAQAAAFSIEDVVIPIFYDQSTSSWHAITSSSSSNNNNGGLLHRGDGGGIFCESVEGLARYLGFAATSSLSMAGGADTLYSRAANGKRNSTSSSFLRGGAAFSEAAAVHFRPLLARATGLPLSRGAFVREIAEPTLTNESNSKGTRAGNFMYRLSTDWELSVGSASFTSSSVSNNISNNGGNDKSAKQSTQNYHDRHSNGSNSDNNNHAHATRKSYTETSRGPARPLWPVSARGRPLSSRLPAGLLLAASDMAPARAGLRSLVMHLTLPPGAYVGCFVREFARLRGVVPPPPPLARLLSSTSSEVSNSSSGTQTNRSKKKNKGSHRRGAVSASRTEVHAAWLASLHPLAASLSPSSASSSSTADSQLAKRRRSAESSNNNNNNSNNEHKDANKDRPRHLSGSVDSTHGDEEMEWVDGEEEQREEQEEDSEWLSNSPPVVAYSEGNIMALPRMRSHLRD